MDTSDTAERLPYLITLPITVRNSPLEKHGLKKLAESVIELTSFPYVSQAPLAAISATASKILRVLYQHCWHNQYPEILSFQKILYVLTQEQKMSDMFSMDNSDFTLTILCFYVIVLYQRTVVLE